MFCVFVKVGCRFKLLQCFHLTSSDWFISLNKWNEVSSKWIFPDSKKATWSEPQSATFLLSEIRVKKSHLAVREDLVSVWSFVQYFRLTVPPLFLQLCGFSHDKHLFVCLFAAGFSAMAAWDWGRHTQALLRLSILILTNLYQKWFHCRLHFVTIAGNKFVVAPLHLPCHP